MPNGKGTYGKQVGRPKKKMYAGGTGKATKAAKPMATSVYKKGGSTMTTKSVKAPAGYHWMKKGSSYKLMKHTGKFVKHTGASLYASFPIQKVHKSGSKKN